MVSDRIFRSMRHSIKSNTVSLHVNVIVKFSRPRAYTKIDIAWAFVYVETLGSATQKATLWLSLLQTQQLLR